MRHLLPALCIALLSLGGCAMLEPLSADPQARIEALDEAGEYGRALALLDRQLAADPDNAQLRRQRADLARRAARFEQRILIEAAEHLRRDNWAGARERYDHGIAVLPDSQVLIAARDAFEVQRQEHLRILRTRLMLARAHGLVRERPLIDEIHRVAPGSLRARQHFLRTEREARELADELTLLGERALAEDDPMLAVEALTLAHALAPAHDSAERLLAAREARQARFPPPAEALPGDPSPESIATEATTQALKARFQAAFAAQDLALARHLLEALEARNGSDPALRRERQLLNQAIDTQVSAGLEEGRVLYAQGRIREALEIWRPLKALAPENRELEAHVERGERVLRRLETGQ